MERIETTVEIDREIDEVFDYATTPANWPAWHPSSLGVEGDVGHSLAVGERVAEEFVVAGRPGRAVWTVREREAPRRWVIDGAADDGNTATIVYDLAPAPSGGTTFRRDLTYDADGPGVDWAAVRARVEAESAEALRRLKAALEAATA